MARTSTSAGRQRLGCASRCSPRSRIAPRRATTVPGSRSSPSSPRAWWCLGHAVTLFATADSVTGGRLLAVAPRAYSEAPTSTVKVFEGLHIAAAFERAADFDLLSNHFDFLPLTYSRLVSTPLVTTIHGFSSERILPVFRVRRHRALRGDQRRRPAPRPDLRGDHPPRHRPRGVHLPRPGRDYLLFLGRIHPDKGAREAVELARRTGLRLVIAGIVQDHDYFRALVRAVPRGTGLRSSARLVRPSGTRCWVARAGCCT